jgi:tRNA nucleotidyltransferase (CCA-adding enzyme)
MDAHTEALARHALDSHILDRVTPERLRAEFNLLFGEPNPVGGIRRLAELGILDWLSPGLAIHLERLERVEGALAWTARHSGEHPDRTVIYLAALLSDLGPRPAGAIARERLRLSEPRQERLALGLERLPGLLERLSAAEMRPHDIYHALQGLPVEAMALVRIWSREPVIEERLEQFLSRLRHQRLEITGDDLLAAGVPPGPRMGEALRRTLDARLDGEVSGREAELAYALRWLSRE